MAGLLAEHVWAHEALPGASDRLRQVIEWTLDASDVSAADVYSLADWIAPLEGDAADGLGLLLIALFLAVNEGSLAVEASPDGLRRRLAGVVGFDEEWIGQALAGLNASEFRHVIGDGQSAEDHDRHPVLRWRNGGRSFLYFQKHLRAERDLYARLSERVGRENRELTATEMSRVFREVLVDAPLQARGKAIAFDRDQLTAVAVATLRDLTIVSGGPGAGKTSVVLTALRCLTRLGVPADRIAVAAPTGRAAQRLGDAMRAGVASLGVACPEVDRALGSVSATTLHGLLDYWPGGNVYRRHEENPIAADVVVVDEVSMASVDQLASLLRAVRADARLILLGDKDQLPSVEAGAVLAQLAPAASPAFSEAVRERIESWLPQVGGLAAGGSHWLRDSVVMLRTNHRSDGGIQKAAAAINVQDAGVLEALPKFTGDWSVEAGCWWWEQTTGTAAEVRGQISRWAEHVYDERAFDGATFLELVREPAPSDDFGADECRAWLGRLFAALERTRLLTLVREGPWGSRPINEAMSAWLRRHSESDGEWVMGTPVLIGRNDRVHGLSNGDVGLTVLDRSGRPRVAFARQGGFFGLPPESLPSHEPGFALTVHKSQGSEYQQVLVVLPATGARRLLTKELLYTAVTRAKGLAIVSGTAESFRAAVGRRIVRESGVMAGGGTSE